MKKRRMRMSAGGKRRRQIVPFARIKALRCYTEVVERLVAGFPCPDVARYIQEEEGEYTDVKRSSLCEHLRDYVNSEVASTDLIAPRLPHLVIKAAKEFGERLEDLRRLERTYEVALYRIDLAHGMERRTGTIDPDVDRHIKGMVDLISQMHAIKMDLGLTGSRDLGTLTVSAERLREIQERYGDGAARAFADPVQRAQVLGLLKRVLRLQGRQDVIDIPHDPEDAEVTP